MDEYIKRADALEIVKRTSGDYAAAFAEIAHLPAADVAEVVRCQSCKHFNLQTHECENENISTDHEGGASYSLNFYDDDFCSYGKRKEADHVRNN